MKFKGFKMGKSKEKNENALAGGVTATQIAELGEQLTGRTNNLKQTEKQLKKLSRKGGIPKESEDILARPHGPIGELTLEPEDDSKVADLPAVEASDVAPGESAETVKLVEVTAEHKVPPPAAKDLKTEDIGDSLNKLFTSDDEEENPLANLIRSLPDVDVNELMDDLQEIKDIIKDWQKK
jgi:hypothetical protein